MVRDQIKIRLYLLLSGVAVGVCATGIFMKMYGNAISASEDSLHQTKISASLDGSSAVNVASGSSSYFHVNTPNISILNSVPIAEEHRLVSQSASADVSVVGKQDVGLVSATKVPAQSTVKSLKNVALIAKPAEFGIVKKVSTPTNGGVIVVKNAAHHVSAVGQKSTQSNFGKISAASAEINNNDRKIYDHNTPQKNSTALNIIYKKEELFQSIADDDVPRLESMISSKANFNVADENGYSPLHLAANLDRLNAVTLLVSVADVNVRDTYGRTPLHYAVRANNLNMIKLLISHGAVVNILDIAGRSCLHYAARVGNLRAVSLLVAGGADVNLRDANGSTALHLAAAHGSIPVVGALLKAGADYKIKNSNGDTAMNVAEDMNRADVVVLMGDIDSK